VYVHHAHPMRAMLRRGRRDRYGLSCRPGVILQPGAIYGDRKLGATVLPLGLVFRPIEVSYRSPRSALSRQAAWRPRVARRWTHAECSSAMHASAEAGLLPAGLFFLASRRVARRAGAAYARGSLSRRSRLSKASHAPCHSWTLSSRRLSGAPGRAAAPQADSPFRRPGTPLCPLHGGLRVHRHTQPRHGRPMCAAFLRAAVGGELGSVGGSTNARRGEVAGSQRGRCGEGCGCRRHRPDNPRAHAALSKARQRHRNRPCDGSCEACVREPVTFLRA
jgi:hypothetical protein